MKRISLLLFASLLCLVVVLPISAQGIIVPPPGVDSDPSTLLIDYQRVTVTIENQIARTHVDMQFTNTGERLAEGTFIFPLPMGATVSNLTMWVDGQAIEGKILAADEAKQIYIDTVRRLIDPALLEYIGASAIQASIFPIEPSKSRRIEIVYEQVLEIENGLFNYVYPLHTAGSNARLIGQMSISVSVKSRDPIRNIYSPSHNIIVSRISDNEFRVGFERSRFLPDADFNLFYGIANDEISMNMLTYRESATEDGFFMLLVQPPLQVEQRRIVPKDVIIVLDQSGSMEGEKWEQAREATAYVLNNLNPQDRFNAVVFSTGWRIYSNELLPADRGPEAANWIKGLFAEGGTDINGALTTALGLADAERPTNILFLTDGLATEGITDTSSILQNLKDAAPSNVRIFTFGVGDDVDTFLLDAIVQNHRGTGSYVRPGERIDEEVASLYNKINAPVLTNPSLEFVGDVVVELLYPADLPDLFAGEQLTLVGRYRGSGEDMTIRLSGMVDGQAMTFVYDGQDFPAVAGGEAFIARLWATRRIGDLLNTIRLQGENDELVKAIVDLSIRYGIITPYTSFLIEENDILSSAGRNRAEGLFLEEAEALATDFTGAGAVQAADTTLNMRSANAPMAFPTPSPLPTTGAMGGMGGGGQDATGSPAPPISDDEDGNLLFNEESGASQNPIQTVGEKTFIWQGGVWTDTAFNPDEMTTEKVVFLSDAYFTLLSDKPELGDYFALGERVIVVLDGVAYEVTGE